MLLVVCQLVWPIVAIAQELGPVGIHNAGRAVEAGRMDSLNAELQGAQPLTPPEVEMPLMIFERGEWDEHPEDALPGYAPGWQPGAGPMPDPRDSFSVDRDQRFFAMATEDLPSSTFGSAPSNPRDGPYPPYQRWTWFGRYLTYPISTIGRLFIDTNGDGRRNASCTASVISERTIATAGHCLKNGPGRWYSGFLFCPSYNASGINPARGCWEWSDAFVSPGWASAGEIDRDFGCIVTSPIGTEFNATLGSQTGWTGRAWNWPSRQPTFVFGYPGNDGFPGYHIIAGSSVEWYEVNVTPGDGQVSKYIGGDQHSGNSGGPWWLSLAHREAEWPAVDSDPDTDPFQVNSPGAGFPYLNGVYSHKRCAGRSCGSPPGANNGLFWNEMGAAQFRSTPEDPGESEDVFSSCFDLE